MKGFKILGELCLVFLAIISVVVSLGYIYYANFIKEITTGTNYIDNQTPVDLIEKAEDLSTEEIDYYENRYLFNVNYFSNNKNNGLELQEMQLNYFTDPSLEVGACRSTGMQYLGDFEKQTNIVENEDEANNFIVNDFYYYDTTNMISWEGGKVATQLNRNTKLIVKIGDKPFLLQLTGKVEDYKKFLWWNYLHSTTYFDYGDIFYDVINAVKTNSAGYGDYYITLDLSNYFTVFEYDETTKKWKEDNVTDNIFTYAVCKFHYDENGAINSNQSLYGIIACNSKYDKTESNVDTAYWQERMVYNLNVTNMSYRYSETYNGYFLSLSLDNKTLFEDMPRAKVNISINLDDDYLKENEINIIGIDYNAFENFEIDTFEIKGNSQTVYLLDKCFYNTNLQTLKYSNGIVLDIAENAFNNEYVEVVL